MNGIEIIPEPKKLEINQGEFTFTEGLRCFVICKTPDTLRVAHLISETIKSAAGIELPIEEISTQDGLYSIVISSSQPEGLPENQVPENEEGYHLAVLPDRLILTSRGQVGLFYAVQSLIQMINQSSGGSAAKIPCCRIEDWPDLQIRGIHINLWSMMPRYEYLRDFIKRLAALKINFILLEYEDKFPYEKHPVLVHPLALTKDQIEGLIKTAKENYIELTPLVQSFGHVEYVLKHDEYAHLAEQVGEDFSRQVPRRWQYCPLNPDSLKMFREMASEVMEIHADAKFFHAGADETFFLGQCPRCKEYVAKHGLSALFVEYMNKVGSVITAKGKIPILWYDYLTNVPKDTPNLSRDFWIMYWEYRMGSRSVPFVRWAGLELSGRELLDEVPQYVLDTFKKYWDDGGFPDQIRGFPYIRYFRDLGFNVLGAARYQGDWRIRVPNTMAFCEALVEDGGQGMVNTHWPGKGIYPLFYGGSEPLEVSWLPIAATAESAWSAGRVSRERFDSKFATVFLGNPADSLIRSAYQMGGIINADTADEVRIRANQCVQAAEKVKQSVRFNHLFLEYLQWSGKIRASLARRTKILKQIEDEILSHFPPEAFSQWIAAEVPLWTGYLAPSAVPEGLDKAGINLHKIEDAIEQLAQIRDETRELARESEKILEKVICKDDVNVLIENFLKSASKIEKYLGKLGVVRTCLRAMDYFKKNFC